MRFFAAKLSAISFRRRVSPSRADERVLASVCDRAVCQQHIVDSASEFSRAVASVSGLGGTGAGIGTLFSTHLIGRITGPVSFEPAIIAASLIPCVATLVFVTMVRARKAKDPAGIVLDF